MINCACLYSFEVQLKEYVQFKDGTYLVDDVINEEEILSEDTPCRVCFIIHICLHVVCHVLFDIILIDARYLGVRGWTW